MFSFQEVPPFFEPGAPPPTLPILIAQTEVGKMQSPTKLLAEEEIGTGSVRRQPSSVRFAPYPNPAKQKTPSPPTAPSKKPPPARSKQLATARSTSDSTSQKSSSSDSDSDSDDDGDVLIAKPEGEAGRPGRGGYNLEEALSWNAKEYRRLKKYVKKLVVDQLEPTKNFSSQSVASLTSVRVMAVQKFPALRGYAACWPVTDLVRLELKYTCGRSRLQVQKEQAKAGRRLTRSSE
ncbi:hypothetical protein BDZ97DRAFT_1924154 [Flammula alnicola]|nr:hypothetical protein BDZ97DRAFT_1924154 [Flammula alnicola]